MSKAALTWEDPPEGENRGARAVWEAEAAALRQHPGKWARLNVVRPRTAGNLAYGIRHGMLKAFSPAGAFEAKSHDGQVWARYIG